MSQVYSLKLTSMTIFGVINHLGYEIIRVFADRA
jgi:hypothetical protein